MLEIGSLVDGKYKILNEIGHGGMSIVYLAMVERANQTWAIKEVRKNGATKDDIVQQGLVAEMNILKRLNHPHLPRIIDIIDYNDSFLIVMDFIEGVDLDKRLQDGPQKWNDVVEWSKQLCDVFAYLHSRTPPIIYRDMKPGNVKLKPNGDVVLFDFGTAREYKSQKAGDDTTCLGTRGYAAPEQYGGMGQTDARSDIYCLGATMFHLVTGRLPGGPPDYVIPPIRSICPWLPKGGYAGNCVRGLEKIIMKCVQPNPANRYQNCAELMYDLEHIDKITDEFVKQQKNKLIMWGTSIALSAVLAVTGGVLGHLSTKTQESNYNDFVNQAFTSVTARSVPYSNSPDSDYHKAESLFIDAIKTDPSNPQAWIYLSKLYSSDYIVNLNEESSLDALFKSSKTGGELKKNENAYAQVCLEWGTDLFFFCGKDGDSISQTIGSGNPDKARPYLTFVAPITPSESETGMTEEQLKESRAKKLVYSGSNSTAIQLDYYKIDELSLESAKERYEFAEKLVNIAKTESGTNNDARSSSGVDTWIKNISNCRESFISGNSKITNTLNDQSTILPLANSLICILQEASESTSNTNDKANMSREAAAICTAVLEKWPNASAVNEEFRLLYNSIISHNEKMQNSQKAIKQQPNQTAAATAVTEEVNG